jgi:hypothetical protein
LKELERAARQGKARETDKRRYLTFALSLSPTLLKHYLVIMPIRLPGSPVLDGPPMPDRLLRYRRRTWFILLCGLSICIGWSTLSPKLWLKQRAELVEVWRNDPFEMGYLRQQISVPEAALSARNVSAVNGTLLAAVVERQAGSDNALFRVFFSTFDWPLPPVRTHVPSPLFDANWGTYHYELKVKVPGQEPIKGELDTLEAREIGFMLPAQLLNATRHIDLTLGVFYGELETQWNFSMSPHTYPRTKKAICIKPLYNRTSLENLVECRFYNCQQYVLAWS